MNLQISLAALGILVAHLSASPKSLLPVNHEQLVNWEVFSQFPYLERMIGAIPLFDGNMSVQFLDVGCGNHVFKITNRSSGKAYAFKVFACKDFDNVDKVYQKLGNLRPSLMARGVHTPDVSLFPCIVEDKIVMATEFLEGDHATDRLLPQIGGLMADLHLTEVPPSPLTPGLDAPMLLAKCSGWEHCAALKRIWDSLDLSYLEALPHGLIHGDFSYTNVLVDKNGDLILIDCDNMCDGYFLDDIGLSQIYFGFTEEGVFKKEHFAAFISAYQQIRPLMPVEKSNLITHVKKSLIEITLHMYSHLHVEVENPSDTEEFYQRIRKQNNYFVDPDFMARAIQSLDSMGDSAWVNTPCHLNLPEDPYQDVLLNGIVLARGNGPICSTRYEAMKQVFDLYQRPFTVLDIGAAEGYFSFRVVSDYPACSVMIGDPEHLDNLLEKLCYANNLQRTILLSKKVTADELAALAKAEHVDVVLALNVVHHFGDDWEAAYNAIRNLGDQIIIETPPNGDQGACGQPTIAPINARVDQEKFTLLGQFQRHTDPNRTDRLIWIQTKFPAPTNPQGIKASTFHALNGTYPKEVF